MSNNRARIFTEVLSVDAWHTDFTSNSNEAQVHVELSFQNGRIGGDDFDLPFTFSVRLRKAIVTITVAPPLQIIRRTVARGVPDSEIELTQYRKVREGASSAFAAKGGVSLKRFILAMSGSTKQESEITLEEEARVLAKVPPILVKPQPGGNQEYRWELEPSFMPALEGQPWDPLLAPRLTIKAKDKPIDPVLRMFVSCKREDLEIYDLELKDKSLDAKLSQVMYHDMNMAAAIQFVRHSLEVAELAPSALNNRFSSMMLADIIVTPEMSDE